MWFRRSLTSRGAWVGLAAAGLGVALVVQALLVHGRGSAAVISHLAVAVPILVVGAVTALVAGRPGSVPGKVMLGLGAIVVAGALANLLPSLVLPGGRGWSAMLPLIHPTGIDFRLGLYNPAATFSNAHSAWPPLTRTPHAGSRGCRHVEQSMMAKAK